MFNFLKKLFSGGQDENLAEIIQNGAFLVDVRTKAEYQSGSVKGAINIPLDTLAGNLAKLKNKDQIVVFCRSGNRSSMAKTILEKNGFSNVANGGSWTNVNQYIK